MMTSKLDAVTGVVTVSIAGITAVLTPDDARQWGEVLIAYAPLALIGFLIWRIRSLDKKLNKCEQKHEEANAKLLLAYSALLKGPQGMKMPTEEEFASGNFDINECLGDNCYVRKTGK